MTSAAHLTVEILPGADHSLTLLDSQRRVVDVVRNWAGSLEPGTVRRSEGVEPGETDLESEATLSISI
jgi:hypothetical protein